MVKFFLNRGQAPSQQPKVIKKRATENKTFYIYIEYRSVRLQGNEKKEAIIPFAAVQKADFSGHGFLEVIHPALALYQIRCSRNQIDFGVVFELEKTFDPDSEFSPDYQKIVWKLNFEKYDTGTLSERISTCRPHTMKIGSTD